MNRFINAFRDPAFILAITILTAILATILSFTIAPTITMPTVAVFVALGSFLAFLALGVPTVARSNPEAFSGHVGHGE